MPITEVRSSGSTIAARNAERGAWSIEESVERRMSRVIVPPNWEGRGKRRRNIADGRCVNTI
jgi:hypothetical protein